MKNVLKLPMVLLLLMLSAPLHAQDSTRGKTLNDALLDKLVGDWKVERKFGNGRTATNLVHVEWVLQHHYLRFHEVSQDKNDKGEPQYDATVFIGWNEKTKQYACVWLDVYGGLTSESIGVATPKGMSLILCSQMSGAKRASRIVLSTIRKRTRGRTGSTIF